MTSRAQAQPSAFSSAVRQLARVDAPLVLLAALVVVGVIAVDNFLTPANLLHVVRSQSLLGIVAIGMTFVVISGNFIDLSVPAVVAISANVALAFQGVGAVPAVVLALTIGMSIGLVNGVIVGVLKVNSVIATLGVGSVVAGLLLWWTGGALSRGSDDALNGFATSRLLGIPTLAILFLLLLVTAHLILTRTRFGAELRLTGGNARAAAISGVPIRKVTILAFVAAGLSAAITGVLLGGFANQADVAVGTGFEFDALIAVVIGGTALTGGRGGFGRTLVGVLLLGMLANLLLLQGVDTTTQLLSRGALFLAVVIGEIISNKARR